MQILLNGSKTDPVQWNELTLLFFTQYAVDQTGSGISKEVWNLDKTGGRDEVTGKRFKIALLEVT